MKGKTEKFTDPRDGKVYKTVKIGEQVWMAENLNFECEGSVCYGNDPKNAEKYGRLYFWRTAMKVCPPGWHLPSFEEWAELVNFAGGGRIAGKKLKAKSGWYSKGKGNGTNEFGFSALPGGYREDFGFRRVGTDGYWWSASKNGNNSYLPYSWDMNNNNDYARWSEPNAVSYRRPFFYSVLCVQDKALQRQEKKMKNKTGKFTDPRDGKVYKTLKIGERIWMAENLNFECEGSKCYDNDPKKAKKYGRLYDWKTAKKACPPGWHLPSKEEWEELVDFCERIAGKTRKESKLLNSDEIDELTNELLGFASGEKIAGEKLKANGFSVLLGGYGHSDGDFHCVGSYGYWWIANENEYDSINAHRRKMFYISGNAHWNDDDKSFLYSVRCVKDKVSHRNSKGRRKK